MGKDTLKIRIYRWNRLDRRIKEELRRQVLLNFPKVAAFKTRFYYQIPPAYMFVAKMGDVLVGQRYLTTKIRSVDGRRYRMVGIGISINPKFQNTGVGQKLTSSTLAFIEKAGYDVVMAVTENPAAEHILRKFGFTKLKRGISYKDVETGKVKKDKDIVFVLDFRNGEVVKTIDSGKGPIYMGVGAW
jgi:RimJ/RimL family protein N-acetyltransferase